MPFCVHICAVQYVDYIYRYIVCVCNFYELEHIVLNSKLNNTSRKYR